MDSSAATISPRKAYGSDFDNKRLTMKISIHAMVLATLMLVGCEDSATRHQPIPVVLNGETGEPVTLQIPRSYVEEPKKIEGPVPNVVLRVPAEDFAESGVFAAESEVRIAIEPATSAADAGHERHAAALRKHKSSVEALLKSKERSKSNLIVYSYPNGEEPDAQAYYLTSKSGDVFVDCRRSVCKAYKTWQKRVHMRFDFRPVDTSNVEAVGASIDRMLQSFAADATATG